MMIDTQASTIFTLDEVSLMIAFIATSNLTSKDANVVALIKRCRALVTRDDEEHVTIQGFRIRP